MRDHVFLCDRSENHDGSVCKAGIFERKHFDILLIRKMGVAWFRCLFLTMFRMNFALR